MMEGQQYHRRSIRLKGYDYARPGCYYVTVCTYQRECVLGSVREGVWTPSARGDIVRDAWLALPGHFANVRLDAFVIMPNHLHAVVLIHFDDPSPQASPIARRSPPRGTRAGSLAAIVQTFKSVSARKINQARGNALIPVWQRNYYERVIRDDAELARVRQYIAENPATWAEDELYA